MGTHCMFSSDVINTSDFYDMPKGAQLLYFYLGLNADRYGVVSNAKWVARGLQIDEAEIQTLINGGYLLSLPGGTLAIADWYNENREAGVVNG